MKIGEVRQALCDAGLSPVGDKNELMKRLAVHYSSLTGNNVKQRLLFININLFYIVLLLFIVTPLGLEEEMMGRWRKKEEEETSSFILILIIFART